MPDETNKKQRYFRYGGQTGPIPDDWTLSQVKDAMARFFSDLAENPKVEEKKEGDKTTVYVFSKQAGRKGSASHPVAGTGNYCRICGEAMWKADHKCAHRWQYCLDDDGDNWGDIYAPSPEGAAEKAARKHWDRQHGEEILIWLREPGTFIATLYPIQIELVPHFEASGVWYWKDRKRPTQYLESRPEESAA